MERKKDFGLDGLRMVKRSFKETTRMERKKDFQLWWDEEGNVTETKTYKDGELVK